MKITTDDLRDEVSLQGLKDEEYTILIGALRAAASDLRPELDYINFYGTERGTVVSFLSRFEDEDRKLP